MVLTPKIDPRNGPPHHGVRTPSQVRKMLVKLGEDVGLPHLHLRLDRMGGFN